MKLITKDKFTFATGMFWQIPDEGKHSLNLRKLGRDTRQNMFCYIKEINTWGFCQKSELNGQRRVASFGQFIIAASKLSPKHANSIICFKFKSSGEIDEGEILEHDLYAYIVLLNGTICPDDGEYVASIEMVLQSIYEKAAWHDIETLYLPVEVSGQFFTIFELLADAYNNEELLQRLILNLTHAQSLQLFEFVEHNFEHNLLYSDLIKNNLLPLEILQQLIKEPLFEHEVKTRRNKQLNYLIPSIIVLPYTSDEIYWNNENFKKIYLKSLIKSIKSKTLVPYKLAIGIVMLSILSYMIYLNFNPVMQPTQVKRKPRPVAVKPAAVEPLQLITACLTDNDKYFQDLGQWTLISIKCNSLGGTLSFNSSVDTTLANFNHLIGKGNNNLHYANRLGTYIQPYKIPSKNAFMPKVAHEGIINNLQQAMLDYGLKIKLSEDKVNSKKQKTKFNIASLQSPLFLYNHKVLDNVRLTNISMNFDHNSGLYNWSIQGEF
ncbi:MAG: hypothetical protein KBD37_00120 [Burkholderiales bacterium]|nr:hypothetical protein [Burkholderiales bacterium]